MLNKNIRLLTWFNFFTDFRLYAPIAIIYFAKVSGSFALGTSILSIVMISSALFEVPTGIYSDYIGRKRTVVLGAVSSFLGICFYAFGGSYLMLVIGATLEGLSRSFYSGNNEALLYDSLSDLKQNHRFHHFLGKLSSMTQIASAVSALPGSLLAAISFPVSFWVSALSQFICIILAINIREPKSRGKISSNIYKHLSESLAYFIRNPKLRLLSISSILSTGISEASFQFRGAFYYTIWPVWALGIERVLSHLGAVLGFRFSGKIIDRFGGLKILFIGAVYNRIADFVGLIFTSLASPVIMSTTSIHFGISHIARSSLMQKEFTDHQRATMGSLNSFAGSILFAVASISLGAVADQLGPGKALLLFEFVLLANIYVYWKLYKSHQG